MKNYNGRTNNNNILNESRWARRDEIESSSLKIDLEADSYEGAGLPVISDAKTAFIDNSDKHSIIFGSTGSKKTRLFCMPMINMMVKAGESFIVTDPKGELYAKTSGIAKENGYEIIVLDFRNIGEGDCWNPLEIPYELYHNGNKDLAMTLINDFVTSLSESHRKTTVDLFWIEMAAALALANLTLLMECGKKEEVHLASFSSMCSNQSVEILQKIAHYIDEKTIAGMNYKSVFTSAEKTLQSIQVSLYAWVRIFVTQKKLTKMLSTNTFDTRNIGKKKTGVYIIVPDEKTTYHFLVTTFIKQVYETLVNEAQKEQEGQLPIRVNFILDEFCNIPAIPDMPAMISAARSRNMRYFLIVQGMHQMNAKYKDDAETIKGNCENWVFLTSKELSLLNEISDLCGVIRTGTGERRKLISVSELQRLDKERGEVLLLYGRKYPFITELADIDEYEMFKGYDPCEKTKRDTQLCSMFSLNRVYNLVRNGAILFEDEVEDVAENIDELVAKRNSRVETFSEIKNIVSKTRKTKKETQSDSTDIDLQAELEKKFDEIFGDNEEDE